MKFSCERCQTRYSIGDEKVQGKVLKIRCKTCGNIIVVREQTAASGVAAVAAPVAAAGGSTSASPAPEPTQDVNPEASAGFTPAVVGGSGALPPVPTAGAVNPTGEIEWFVAIKGKQHGPAKFDDIVRLFREGKINERAHLWHDKMGAWTRLKDVPEAQFLLSEAKKPPPPPPEGAEILSLDEARAQRQGGDPFSAVANAPMAGADQAPRDSTRVFIMNAGLHNRGKKHRFAAVLAGVFFAILTVSMFLDYKGYIEIPGLHRVMNVVAQREDYVAPVAVAWETGEEDPELKCKLMPNPDECKKKVIAENAIKRQIRAKRQAASGPTLDQINAGFANSGAVAGGGDVARVGTIGPDGIAEMSNANDAAKIKAMFDDRRGGPKVPVSRMEQPAVSGGSLDAENVGRVVKDGAVAVQSCVEAAAKAGNLPSGKQKLIITVSPRGVVENAMFQNGAVSASPVGECIRSAARRWKFAPFPGDATDVEIPLILSVN